MLDPETRQQIVEDIENTFETRQPLPLLTKTYPEISVEDAYAIQDSYIKRRVAEGRSVRGYKVGLTSKVMQETMGGSEPDFSAMTDDLFLPEDTEIEASRFFRPMIEIEVAFLMKDYLKGPGILPQDVIMATEYVLPSIEIVDFRVGPAQGMTIADTVSDMAACGATILGANPRRLEYLDLRNVRGELIINDQVVQEGFASAVLGHPVNSIAWLANKLGSFGVTFEPGQIILSGSFVRAMPIKGGDKVVARFDQGLGDVISQFV